MSVLSKKMHNFAFGALRIIFLGFCVGVISAIIFYKIVIPNFYTTEKEIIGFKNFKLNEVITENNYLKLYGITDTAGMDSWEIPKYSDTYWEKSFELEYHKDMPDVMMTIYLANNPKEQKIVKEIKIRFKYSSEKNCWDALESTASKFYNEYSVPDLTYDINTIEDINQREISFEDNCNNSYSMYANSFTVIISASKEHKRLRESHEAYNTEKLIDEMFTEGK